MKIDTLTIISGLFFCFTFVPVAMVMTGTFLSMLGIL